MNTDSLYNTMFYPLLVAVLVHGMTIASAGLPSFAVLPRDTQTVEGRTAVLECVIGDTTGHHYAQWIKGGKAISSNYTIHTTRLIAELDIMEPLRYQIIGDFSRGEFNLQIVNTINSQDDDIYQCIVADQYGPLLFSDEVQLSVASPSAEQYPMCLPSTIQTRYMVGDVITTECVFRHGDSSMQLQWTYSGRIYPGERMFTTLPDISRDWILTADHDGAVFTCETATPEPQRCQIGPITVVYAPRVYIEPAAVRMTPGGSVMFTCSALSNPAPSAYVWEINGKVVVQSSNKFSFSDNGKYFTIDQVNSDENDIVITCLAANTIGLGVPSAPATLQVEGSEQTRQDQVTHSVTTNPTITTEGNKDRTLPIIIVAVAAGVAVIFSIIVVILFRRTVLKCCRTDAKGMCWKAQKNEKPAPVPTNELRFSNLAELSSMIASSLKQKQLEDTIIDYSKEEQDDSPVTTPYTSDITIV